MSQHFVCLLFCSLIFLKKQQTNKPSLRLNLLGRESFPGNLISEVELTLPASQWWGDSGHRAAGCEWQCVFLSQLCDQQASPLQSKSILIWNGSLLTLSYGGGRSYVRRQSKMFKTPETSLKWWAWGNKVLLRPAGSVWVLRYFGGSFSCHNCGIVRRKNDLRDIYTWDVGWWNRFMPFLKQSSLFCHKERMNKENNSRRQVTQKVYLKRKIRQNYFSETCGCISIQWKWRFCSRGSLISFDPHLQLPPVVVYMTIISLIKLSPSLLQSWWAQRNIQ